MRINAQSNYRGTTLIEVIIAMIIFSVLMLGGMSFFVFARKFSTNAKQEMIAVYRARCAIDQAMTYKWTTMDPAVPYGGTFTTADGTTYTRSGIWTIVPYGSGSTNLKQLHYSLTWTGQPPSEVVDYDVLIAEPKVN